MSGYSNFSSTSSESGDGIWTSNGSTYSTQRTAQSNDGNTSTITPQHFYGQAYYTGGEEPLLRDVGTGPNLELPSNPSTASGNINGIPPYGYCPPAYMQQYGAKQPTEDPFPARMQLNQGVALQNTMAQGSRRIESHTMPNCDMNYSQMQWQLPYGYGANQAYTDLGSVTSSQQSQSTSWLPPILIERQSPPASNRRKPKGPRYPCRVPGCPVTFSRRDSVNRHMEDIHTDTLYVVCDICGHWETLAREDKMQQYCRGKHRGQYSVHIEESVGQQSHVRPSTSEKQSRRRKTPIK